MRYFRWLLIIGLWSTLLAPRPAAAQTVNWNERRTLQFSILYPDGAQKIAAQYADFVDLVYEEASLWWGYRTPTPIVLRVYPTMELYLQTNPQAAVVPGVVAHAHTGRREISIAIPQTEGQTPDEITNNVRHELAHLIAADLSGGKLTTLWQEGIAQNAEHPSGELDRKMDLMRQIITADAVASWAALDQPGAAYANPQISYPQSYTIVGFLLRRNDMRTFKAFTEAMRQANDYRAALQTAYGVGADQLEKEWLAQLQTFVDGGYRTPPQPKFDLGPAQTQIQQGEYAAAILTLSPMLAQMGSVNDPALVQATNGLLEQARSGQWAVRQATNARTLLSSGAYAEAQQAASGAAPVLIQLGQAEQAAVALTYADLAARGIAAEAQLGAAQDALRRLQLTTARTMLNEAYLTFTELGDAARAAQAQASLIALQRGQYAIALFLLLCALIVLCWNGWQRRAARPSMIPFS